MSTFSSHENRPLSDSKKSDFRKYLLFEKNPVNRSILLTVRSKHLNLLQGTGVPMKTMHISALGRLSSLWNKETPVLFSMNHHIIQITGYKTSQMVPPYFVQC